MAITETELSKALSRASLLMSSEGQKQIDAASKQTNNRISRDVDYQDKIMSQGTKSYTNESVQIHRNSNCKLPKVIQESILNNPISNTINEYSTESSILDSISYNNPQQTYQHTQESYLFRESTSNPNEYQQHNINTYQNMPQSNTSIDYNYIRSIINECVQTNLQKIKEEILKESSLKTIRLSNENKIQLIDNKNNLFESKLEFRKNISKK